MAELQPDMCFKPFNFPLPSTMLHKHIYTYLPSLAFLHSRMCKRLRDAQGTAVCAVRACLGSVACVHHVHVDGEPRQAANRQHDPRSDSIPQTSKRAANLLLQFSPSFSNFVSLLVLHYPLPTCPMMPPPPLLFLNPAHSGSTATAEHDRAGRMCTARATALGDAAAADPICRVARHAHEHLLAQPCCS